MALARLAQRTPPQSKSIFRSITTHVPPSSVKHLVQPYCIFLVEADDCRLVANNHGSVALNPGLTAVLVANNPGWKMP